MAPSRLGLHLTRQVVLLLLILSGWSVGRARCGGSAGGGGADPNPPKEPDSPPSPQPHPADSAPTRIRLVVTAAPTGVVVCWNSNSDHGGEGEKVVFGEDKGKLDRTATSAGGVLRARLSGLKPGATYYYKVGKEGAWSKVLSFTTAPADAPTAGGPPARWRFLALADQGSSENAERIVKGMETDHRDVRLVLAAGDLAKVEDDNPDAGWGAYLDMMAPLLSKVPFAPAKGEHDNEDSFHRAVALPEPGPSKNYYGFKYGVVYFAVICTEQPIDAGSSQHRWLDEALGKARRGGSTWLVVIGHHTLYSNYMPFVAPVELRKGLEPLFKKHQVALGIWGHVHNYERTTPVGDNGKGIGHGTVHITLGTGGQPLYSEWKDKTKIPKWSAKRLAEFGHLAVDVLGRDALSVKFVSAGGEVKDKTTIFRHKALERISMDDDEDEGTVVELEHVIWQGLMFLLALVCLAGVSLAAGIWLRNFILRKEYEEVVADNENRGY